MKSVQVPSDAVLIVFARAQPNGPQIDFDISEEWWASADQVHREAMFAAVLDAVKRTNERVNEPRIQPDEFNRRYTLS